MKLLCYDAKPYDIPPMEASAAAHGLTVKFLDTRLSADTAGLADGFDAVCVFVNDDVSAPVIDRLHAAGVRFLALRCAGYNNVDLAYCRGRLRVVHVPAYSPYAVAEHTMALLLTSVRRIHKAYNRTRDFNFSLSGLTGFDLHGKTVGIIGSGRIGRVFADICRGFGMRVLAYDKYPAADSGLTYTDTDTLYAESDIISLHCPLTAETYHMISAQAIRQMKKGVVLLNTSRGALIDAEALLEGIKARKIGAACLDVYEEEADIFFRDTSGHILNDDTLARLISMPNVIVTSHQAFLTEEALSNIAETTVRNLLALASGEPADNELCFPDSRSGGGADHRCARP